MNKDQIIKTLTENLSVRLTDEAFEELQEQEGLQSTINEFEIERVGRGFSTVDLWHMETEEVLYDIDVEELTDI